MAFATLGVALSLGRPSHAETDAEGHRVHTVYAGQTPARIARRYGITVDALYTANGLRRGARIRPGQKLLIPEKGDAPDELASHCGNRWQDYAERPRRRGYVVLVAPTKHWQGYVLTSRGKLIPKARDAIERMFASWRTGVEHDIDTRLIQLVVRVSDTFGGRPLRVVSGYREHSFAEESKHKVGRAFDFSIPGIPNALVRDYLRTLRHVGVGYYPNATHVHLDVREESAYWVDEAGPGEPPRYLGSPPKQTAQETAAPASPPSDATEPTENRIE